MLKEIFYTGIGATALLKERVEEEIKKLEEKGKIKTDDAKSFLESIEQKGKEEDEKLKNKFKEILKEVIDELGIATKEDIAKLKEERQ
ncbi:MAG: hypothetical protein KU38_12725 [Sulfurovum sp. FS08-3]|nr:MAG: hypothetical protein KU38_12725 [Sulfurovum sp. FS08-3]